MNIEEFRETYRREKIGASYSGPGHLAFTSFASLVIIVTSCWFVVAPTLRELAIVPVGFLFANFAEYMGHRFSMHRPRFPRFVYRRHTIEHHAFFTHERMDYDSRRDWKAVLFPAPIVLFFFVAFGVPGASLLLLVATKNAALLFLATIFSYFLTYEWLHFSYHMHPDSAVGRNPLVRRLRQHHQAHHDKALMAHYNFNITFPIFDWIFGTTKR